MRTFSVSRAGARNTQRQRAASSSGAFFRAPCKRAGRLKSLENLQRADQPLWIGRAQSPRRLGVHARKPREKVGGRNTLAFRAHPRPHRVRHGGDVGQALQQTLEIHAGATDEHSQAPVRPTFGQGPARVLKPLPYRIVAFRADMSEKQMRSGGLFRSGRLRREDRQVGVNLHGIRVDRGGAGFFRDGGGERRLAACGRTCDEHGLQVFVSLEFESVQHLMAHKSR